jgi:hypothetical protein
MIFVNLSSGICCPNVLCAVAKLLLLNSRMAMNSIALAMIRCFEQLEGRPCR